MTVRPFVQQSPRRKLTKHRHIWPVSWLCDALDVSRSGFHACLGRAQSRRSREDEEIGAKVRASFIASARTYGARRVWRDLLAEGVDCGLHRIERLMQAQAFRPRPLRRGLPKDEGQRVWLQHRTSRAARSTPRLRTRSGSPTSPVSGPPRAGFMGTSKNREFRFLRFCKILISLD